MGLGMGIASVSSMVLIQEIAAPANRGSATASNLFSRNLGNTLGATLFGAVLNYGLTHTTGAAAITADQIKQLLEAGATDISRDSVVRLVLHHSLHVTFLAMFVISLAVLLIALLVPTVALKRKGPVLAHEAL